MFRGGEGGVFTHCFNDGEASLLDLVVTGSCQREGHVYIVVNGKRSRSFLVGATYGLLARD